MSNIQLLNEDNKTVMARYPDRYFDLAIVDPPYGISQPAFRKESKNKAAKPKSYNNAVFNQGSPDKSYFDELFRVSKNQIIWGGNYYCNWLPEGKKWIFWDKKTEETQWGDGELAFTSLPGAITKVTFAWNGMIQGDMKNKEIRIHPTQKPVKLYQWLYDNYAKPDFKILDTHLGSGSNAIAANQFGISEFVGCEIDENYYHDAVKRFNLVTSQQNLFKAS